MAAALMAALSASVGANPLPDPQQVLSVIAASPAVAAAQRGIEAEQAGYRQGQIGPHEYTASTNVARRVEPTGAMAEWELAIERPIRWAGKQEIAGRVGSARVATARAAWYRAWREQARLLLDRYGTWLREGEAMRVAAEQVRLLQEQSEAVSKRQRLGDAPKLERLQADAALAQAQAQWLAVQGRRDAAGDALRVQFAGLSLTSVPPLPDPLLPAGATDDAVEVMLQASPELTTARRDVEAMSAQLESERAEQRPDPTIGVRVGQAKNGAEKFVGVTFKLPFGGEWRAAGVSVTASRLAQSEALRDELVHRLAADAAIRLRERQSTHAGWQSASEAARQLDLSAVGLARAYQLGEGSLGEVLNARRLANDQKLAATLAGVDAWLAAWRVDLEAGRLWSVPPSPPF